MKKISILGSTGSIGINTLDVVKKRPHDFKIIGLSAYENVDLLANQIKVFRPRVISVKDDEILAKLRKLVDLSDIKVFTKQTGLINVATHKQAEIVVVATSGTVSLVPTLMAIEQGKTIALANKEPLVMAGEIVMDKIKKKKALLIPVDSEHSAIFQCLKNENHAAVKRIYLTGTGGPFRKLDKMRLPCVNLKMTLNHPKWKMGKKITIDSATLMNKGLEIIEAKWLFDIAVDKIEILIHPEAIIHSMVEFQDHSILAQLGMADMRLPIQYALDYPQRKPTRVARVDFIKLKKMAFLKPDLKKFPCLKIAYEVARKSGSSGCVMNAANEIAVQAFIEGAIKFTAIPNIIRQVLNKHKYNSHPTLKKILELDDWAKGEARLLCYPH